MSKRILSVFMAIALLFSLCSVTAFAKDNDFSGADIVYSGGKNKLSITFHNSYTANDSIDYLLVAKDLDTVADSDLNSWSSIDATYLGSHGTIPGGAAYAGTTQTFDVITALPTTYGTGGDTTAAPGSEGTAVLNGKVVIYLWSASDDKVVAQADKYEATITNGKGTAPSYTITWDNEGTTNTTSVVEGDAVTLPDPAPTKAGYRFKGWFTAASGGTQITTATVPTANTTYYAQWAQEYTVTYALNGGSGTLPTSVDRIAGEKFNLAPSTGLTKNGYTFGGWNDGATTTAAGAQYTMTAANTTLTAVWTPVPVTLTAAPIQLTKDVDVPANTALPTATGGDGTFTYTYTLKNGGTLPAGVTLSASGSSTPITVSGKPTATGSVTIVYKAESPNGESKEVEITLTVGNKPLPTLSVSPATVSGKVGGTQTLTVTTASTGAKSFESSDEDVVTVDANGKLTFVGEGTATVTVTVAEDTTYGEKTVSVAVTVSSAADPHDPFMFGYKNPDNTVTKFGPDDHLTRAQAVTILARLKGWTDGTEVEVSDMFSDVKEKDAKGNDIWYYDAVCFAKKNGITEGKEDGTFGPDENITRAEFTKMLASMTDAGKNPTGADASLADAKAHWANKWIGYVETNYAGSITGREDNLFHPNDDITRAEVAKIVNGYLGRLQSVSAKEADQLDADLNAFDDVNRCTWYYNNVVEATVQHDASDTDFHTAG